MNLLATIKDVAELANVSKSTVSNVFSKKKYISPELTEKVLAAAKELDFHSNYFAKTLATKQSKIIGISIQTDEQFHSNFQQNIIRGILSECAKSGYYLLIEPTGIIKEDYLPLDGIIILDPKEKMVIPSQIPHVWVGLPPEVERKNVSYINNDNYKLGQELTHILLENHSRIAFLNSYASTTVAPERYAGYLSVYHSKFPDEEFHYYCPENQNTQDFAYHKAKELLQRDDPPTAFILDSDLMAQSLYHLASELSLTIPKDLAIIAIYSSFNASNIFTPTLTTVNLHEYQLGKEAAKLLISQLQDKDTLSPDKVIINGSIQIGNSI